jgi:hypothetical protein
MDYVSPRPWYKNVYVIVVIVISVVGVAMAALLFLLAERPEELIRSMQWKMVRANSFRMEADITWQGEVSRAAGSGGARTTTEEAMHLRSGGIFDGWDKDVPKHRHEFEITLGSASPQTFGGEYRRIGRKDYLNFDTAPGILGTFQLGSFRDRWLFIEPQRILSRIDSPFVPKTWERLDELDEAYLLEQFRITPFLAVREVRDDEMIRGVRTAHLLVRPEIIFIKDYFSIAQAVRFGRELTPVEQRQIDDVFADVTAEHGEVWIGKSDKYLHRMTMRFRFNGDVRKGTLDMTFDFSDFDQRFKIDTPTEEVQDIEPILSSLLPTVLPNLPLSDAFVDGNGDRVIVDGADGRTYLGGDGSGTIDPDPDGDGLTNSLELFYGSDPNGPDTDGDGMNDGDEVAASRNPTGPGKLFDFGITDALERGSSAPPEQPVSP